MSCVHCDHELPVAAAFCPWCGHAVEGATEPADYTYDAFISYRHTPVDERLAARLQRRIEGFRVPGAKRRLGKVFRDVEELSVGDSLPDLIDRALAGSRFLVVVCSPEMRESPWVAREVERFAAYHGRGRIILALAAGEPQDAFPPLLMSIAEREGEKVVERPTEPLAADLRDSSRRAFREGSLRVIAPIAGVGFDDLRQRSRTRRAQRLAAAGGVAAVLGVSFGGFALWQQAQIQANYDEALRNESEYLAEEARTLLGKGDRMQAIQVALHALGAEGDERPYVPSARVALEEACQVYPGDFWQPCYSIEEEDGFGTVSVSPDGSAFAVRLASNEVRVYDVATGRERARVPAHEDAAPVCFLADGVARVEYEDGESRLSLYDAATGERVWSTQVPQSGRDLVASPEGSLVAVPGGSYDDEEGMTLEVLRSSDGEKVAELRGLRAGERSLEFGSDPMAFSDDGATLAVAMGGELGVLDVASGEWRQVPSGMTGVSSLVVGGGVIYVGGVARTGETAECVVRALDLGTLEERWSWRDRATSLSMGPLEPRLFGVGTSESGPALIMGSGHRLLVLAAEDGAVLLDQPTPGPVNTAYQRPGGSIAYESDEGLYVYPGTETTMGSDGTSYVGGVVSPTLFDGGVSGPAMSSSDMFADSSGNVWCLFANGAKTVVYKLDVSEERPGREDVSGETASAAGYGFDGRTADGGHFLGLDDDDVLHVFDGTTFELERSIELRDALAIPETASTLDVSPSPEDDDVVYVSWYDLEEFVDRIAVIDVSDGEVLAVEMVDSASVPIEVHDGRLTHFSPDVVGGGELVSRDAHTLEELALVPVGRDLGPGDEMGTLGDLVVLVVDDRIATLDAATGEDVTCALSDVAPVEVRTIGLSPTLSDMSPDSYGRLILNEDHTRLLTAGEDGAICLWDESGELLWELEAGTGTFGAAEFLMFLPSGDVFVQGSISAAGMGQHLLVDGETGSVIASSDDAPLISDAWPSQDGTSLFASSRSYAFVTLASSFVDGIFTIDLSPESFGVDSQMPYAVAVSQDEERALFYNQMAEELFTLPTYTTDELVAYARELTAGHELSAAERRIYRLE